MLDDRRQWKWAVLLVLALGVTGLEAVGAVLVYALVDVISAPKGGIDLPILGDLSTRFPDVATRSLQLAVAIGVAVFFLIRAVVIVVQEYLQSRVVHNAGAQVATRLVRGYLAMPYVFHTQRNSAELVRNAFDSAQRFVGQVMMPLVKITAESLLVLGLTSVLLVVSPAATLLALVALGPMVWLLLRAIQPRIKTLGRQSQEASTGSLQSLQQALGGFRDIRLLGSEERFADLFRRQRVELARTEYAKATLIALPRVMIETAVVLVIVGMLVVTMLARGGLGSLAGALGAFAYVGMRLQTSLRVVAHHLNELRFGSAILEDIREDHDRIRDMERLREERRRGSASYFVEAIELRNVSFAYDPEGAPALEDVSIKIRKGEFIGICGPTGGGKSTLVDVIVGLLEPTSGRVLVDGEDLLGREVWWHSQLGVVSQSVFLIDDTLRANIAFGRGGEEIDEAALMRAVSRAQLGDVVAGLAQGLDTMVGERGVRLSGGQRQRVAIARALYREPSVLVFDEGTSALDTVTEAALVTALDELKQGRTLISVAHRISTVRDADRILVIGQGQLKAEGSYEELLTSSPTFRALAG